MIHMQDASSTYLITEHGVSKLESVGNLLEAWGLSPEDLEQIQRDDLDESNQGWSNQE